MSWGASKEDWLWFDLVLGLGADLLPVVSNPEAEISPDSRMKSKGKTPSVYNRQRKVAGFPKWTAHSTEADDLERWAKEEDYGICVQTRLVRGLDVDVPDLRLAEKIVNVFCGALRQHMPLRIRNATGKRLGAFILPGEFSKRSFKIDGGLVEFLAGGQQFIAVGTHPSGTRYEWVGGLPDAFPVISAEQFERAWEAIRDEFAIEAERRSGDRLHGRDSVEHSDVPDPVADFLEANWPTFGTQGGKLFVECPWKMGHSSDSGETEAAWLLAGTNGYQQGHYECLHASCSGRADEEFLDAVGYRLADFDELPAVQENGERFPEALPPFKRDKQGRIEATVDNVRMALERCDLTGFCVRYDTFRGEIMLADHPAGSEWRSFKDPDYFELRMRLERSDFKPVSKEMMRDAVHWIANKHQFDTAQDWLRGLTWDGVKRIDEFFPRYFKTDDTPYTRAAGAYVWTAQAGRVMDPGCIASMVPVLVGRQGSGKSRGVAAISPVREFVAEFSFHEEKLDRTRKMRGCLVGELAELQGLRTRELEDIKAWVTQTHENWTPKFIEHNVTFARRMLFWGTTNEQEFLADETGERRWLPLRVGTADVAAITRDAAQMWAEGAVRWAANGVEFAAAEKLAAPEHRTHRVTDVWENAIQSWLNVTDLTGEAPKDSPHIRLTDVLTGALGLDLRHVGPREERRVGKILHVLGYERALKRVEGQPVRVWVTPNADGLRDG